MKAIYNLLLIAITVTAVQAQDFYNLNTIQTIEVTFAESNWDQLMDIAKASDSGYILAQSVTINGEVFDSVGVKYKGNSSYNANQIKNPWHIELDTYKDHEYDGFTDIKLANGTKDPSMIRDVLGYQIVRQYMAAPQANFANLFVNGQLIGLYANTESISKKFMNSRFGSNENTRFKCSPPDGAGQQSTNLPKLIYLGQDSTDYYEGYELQSDSGWQELIDLCDTLANHTNDIEKMLDVNRALWMLAFDNVIVNLDSYIGNFAQNYYLYRSEFGQFLPVVWDLNESFGVFAQTGSGNLNNTTSKQRMTHLLHENNNNYPLVQNLLSVPTYKKMYLAHMKTILLENFDNGLYLEMGLTIQEIIDEAVQADNNKFFTYNNFLSNLTSDVTSGGGGGGRGQSAPGISNLMSARSAYLLGLSDFSQSEPVISDVRISNSNPSLQESVTINATISSVTDVYLGYRSSSLTAPFTRIEMFDDGTHNDGAANDGVYGTELTLNSTSTEYYIYAENENIGMFSPKRAEFEFYTINAEFNFPTDGIVINEFMASNDTDATDQNGEFEDWIELYNNGSETVDLNGYFLSDDSADPMKWTFPEGVSLESDSYLIVWADEDLEQEGLHADFKLSSSGETIILSDRNNLIIDALEYPEQTTDVSYARIPNATGDFRTAVSTFNSNNDSAVDCSSAGGDLDNDGVCANDDCDDRNASIGRTQVEGTACNDDNAMTQNDIILADGCICEGTDIVAGDIVINEFMASNDVTAADQNDEFEDWIELYNNGSESIDLSGYFLSDNDDDMTQWAFPDGTVIGPNEYLIIWADEDVDQAGLHADFKLSGSGESILLVNPIDTSIIDAVTYQEQTTDISFGRIPNGIGPFQFIDPPTFNTENTITTSLDETSTDNDDLKIYPNPAEDYFFIWLTNINDKNSVVTIYNTTAKIVFQENIYGKTKISTSDWTPGMYIVKSEDAVMKIVIQ